MSKIAAIIANTKPRPLFKDILPCCTTWYIAGTDIWARIIKITSIPTDCDEALDNILLKHNNPIALIIPDTTTKDHFTSEILPILPTANGVIKRKTIPEKNIDDVFPVSPLLFMINGHTPKKIPAIEALICKLFIALF